MWSEFMPSGAPWPVESLGELCKGGKGDIQTGPFGSQLHASDYVEDGVPAIMPQNIVDARVDTTGIARITEADAERLDRYRVRAGDIVYSRRGDIRRRALITSMEDGWLCGTGCLRIRPGPRVDSRFLFFYLGHPAVQDVIARHAVGATMPNLNTSILASVPVRRPSMDVQRAIAKVLGALDDKMTSSRQLAARLANTAHVEFRRLFGGRVEGPDRLGEHVSVVRGRSYKSSELVESERALVTLKSVRPGGGYSDRGLKSYAGDFRPEQIVQPNELVVAHTDLTQSGVVIGKPAVIPDNGGFTELVASLDLAIVRPRSERVSVPFLYHLMLEPAFQHHVYGWANGSTVLHLAKEAVPSFSIALPLKESLQSFEQLAEPLHAYANSVIGEIRTLSSLRDILLPKLISGEIRVPYTTDPEEVIGSAAEEIAA